jgi:hypothetical protein
MLGSAESIYYSFIGLFDPKMRDIASISWGFAMAEHFHMIRQSSSKLVLRVRIQGILLQTVAQSGSYPNPEQDLLYKKNFLKYLQLKNGFDQKQSFMYVFLTTYTVKKKDREFPVPSRDVTTKLSLGGNNDVITELFLPRGSLVSDIPAGDGKLENLFLRCTTTDKTHWILVLSGSGSETLVNIKPRGILETSRYRGAFFLVHKPPGPEVIEKQNNQIKSAKKLFRGVAQFIKNREICQDTEMKTPQGLDSCTWVILKSSKTPDSLQKKGLCSLVLIINHGTLNVLLFFSSRDLHFVN